MPAASTAERNSWRAELYRKTEVDGGQVFIEKAERTNALSRPSNLLKRDGNTKKHGRHLHGIHIKGKHNTEGPLIMLKGVFFSLSLSKM